MADMTHASRSSEDVDDVDHDHPYTDEQQQPSSHPTEQLRLRLEVLLHLTHLHVDQQAQHQMHHQVQEGSFQLVQVQQSTENSCEDSCKKSHAVEGLLVLHDVLGIVEDWVMRGVLSSLLREGSLTYSGLGRLTCWEGVGRLNVLGGIC